tara:strand:+ start:210 stop:1142 length:933 start_codon:yes stop_codon:yes gene_type:complete
MEPLIQLLGSFDALLISIAIVPPAMIALLASRHMEATEYLEDWQARFRYAWSKVVLDTALIWGIALCCLGFIGMILNMDDMSGLGDSVTIAFSVLLCAGLTVAVAHVLEKKELTINLRLSPLEGLLISLIFGGFLIEVIGQTGVPFFRSFFHPILYPTQVLLTGILVLLGILSKKPWQSVCFEANLGVTLLLMAIGITAWFLNWTSFEDSRQAIWLIANVLFWGSIFHIYLYILVLIRRKEHDVNLRIKTWHFTEAFAFYAFLVYAPIGATEYFRESSDQTALQAQHESQQSEIDKLKARLTELEEQKTN